MSNYSYLILILVLTSFSCRQAQSYFPETFEDELEKQPISKKDFSVAMVNAVNEIDGVLNHTEKERMKFPFLLSEREEWTFVPRNDRKGLRIGKLEEYKQEAIFNLLKVALSQKGYETAREIMDLESVLVIKENQAAESDYRNPGKYFISIFGKPSLSEPWGWKYEGHHLSLNYTSVAHQLSVTPAFLGANPAEVDIDMSRGKRVLGEQEDLGRILMMSLSKEQQQKALIAKEAYFDIVTGTASHAKIENYEGLKYSELAANQKAHFIKLIKLHISVVDEELADKYWDKIEKSGLEKFYFAWAGGLKKGEKHYYRIHGPTTIIEYDNAQNNGNHAHIVWRDSEDDFGRNYLKEHYEKHRH